VTSDKDETKDIVKHNLIEEETIEMGKVLLEKKNITVDNTVSAGTLVIGEGDG
jgi:hypothetical protein